MNTKKMFNKMIGDASCRRSTRFVSERSSPVITSENRVVPKRPEHIEVGAIYWIIGHVQQAKRMANGMPLLLNDKPVFVEVPIPPQIVRIETPVLVSPQGSYVLTTHWIDAGAQGRFYYEDSPLFLRDIGIPPSEARDSLELHRYPDHLADAAGLLKTQNRATDYNEIVTGA